VEAQPLLVVVLGPTASGKTALSLALARRFQGEIVSCDSVALYRDFEIGTAKPGPDERGRIPHHMLDCVDPSTYVTAGGYARQARTVLHEIKARGSMPIVVGGTGLYLRALLDGLFSGPQRSEELRARLRQRADQRPPGYLFRVLRRLDPAVAEKMHANDTAKLMRAIEVCLASRQPISEMWAQGRDPLTGFRILRMGLKPAREALYTRINQRAQQMFAAGLVEETQRLLKKYGDTAYPIMSIGYKQALQVIREEMDTPSALLAAQQAHRNYAKRQITWFARERNVSYLAGFGDDPGIQAKAIEMVEEVLRDHRVPPAVSA
jgi:tRNA dimethylallyltransferase